MERTEVEGSIGVEGDGTIQEVGLEKRTEMVGWKERTETQGNPPHFLKTRKYIFLGSFICPAAMSLYQPTKEDGGSLCLT